MKTTIKILGVTSSIAFSAFGFIFAISLSTPRDFSSPPTVIKIIDENDKPISGIEISRNWYDSDCRTEGGEKTITDTTGTALFDKIPARVGIFTGISRKMIRNFASCGAGSGTETRIYVRYPGRYSIQFDNNPVLSKGQTFRDKSGVTFYTSTDSLSNTVASLCFPMNTKSINCALSSIRQPEK